MSLHNVTLEPSEGPTVQNPTKEQVRSMLGRIGSGLDHCILSYGTEDEFVQAAGGKNRLLIQYSDAGGMFESVRSDLDVAVVERAFIDAMSGVTSWKTELTFQPMDAPKGGGPAPRGNSSSPKRSPEQEMLDAAKRAAKAGVTRLVKGGLRGLFGGKP